MKNYKYSAKFSGNLKVAIASEQDKYLAQASIKNTKGMFGDKFNPSDDKDLLYFVGEAFVANAFNKNSDGINSKDAIILAKNFINKYINIEHNREEVVGFFTNYKFTDFAGEDISESDASDLTSPYKVSLSGILWKTVRPDFIDLVLASQNPLSDHYNKCAISWEVAFSEYQIASGATNYLEDCKVIEDEESFAILDSILRANGGSGRASSGEKVHRLIVGEIVGLGGGITVNPAAEVDAIQILASEKSDLIDTLKKIEETKETLSTEISHLVDNIELAAAEQKLENKKSVKDNRQNKTNKNMIFKSLKDITDDNLKEATASSIVEFVAKEIDKTSIEFADKLETKEKEIKAAKDLADSLDDKFSKANEELVKLQKVEKVNQALANEKIQSDFNLRMSDLDENFEINEDQGKAIAKQIRGLEDQEYNEWKSSFSAFLFPKKKVKDGDKIEKKMKDGKPVDEDDEDKEEKDKKKKAKASIDLDGLESDDKKVNFNLETNKTSQDLVNEAFADLLK